MQKKIIIELAPKPNIIGRRGLKGLDIVRGMNIPKNIAALWGQKPRENNSPQRNEPIKLLLAVFFLESDESCSWQCSLVFRFANPKTIRIAPIIFSPFS